MKHVLKLLNAYIERDLAMIKKLEERNDELCRMLVDEQERTKKLYKKLNELVSKID